MFEAPRTADDPKKLREDARGSGPRQAGPYRIGVFDMIVGEGGVEVPGFVATKNETPVGAVLGYGNYPFRLRIFLIRLLRIVRMAH